MQNYPDIVLEHIYLYTSNNHFVQRKCIFCHKIETNVSKKKLEQNKTILELDSLFDLLNLTIVLPLQTGWLTTTFLQKLRLIRTIIAEAAGGLCHFIIKIYCYGAFGKMTHAAASPESSAFEN